MEEDRLGTGVGSAEKKEELAWSHAQKEW